MNGIPGKLSIVRHMALPVFPYVSPHGDFLQPVDGLQSDLLPNRGSAVPLQMMACHLKFGSKLS
jgi:hypothetical protein